MHEKDSVSPRLQSGRVRTPGQQTPAPYHLATRHQETRINFELKGIHMIDEELVGFLRPAQRLAKRCAEMTDDRLVMADAGLIAGFANRRCAGLLGDVVERGARQIE